MSAGSGKSSSGSARGAVAVAVGILLSRIFGLVRQRIFLRYLGVSPEADAFTQAVRIPNLLQNLFGEGALSASFIPVYSRLRASGDDAGRRAVAGAVLGLLMAGMSLLVVGGILAAPWLVDVIAPGFEGAKRDLTVRLVRIMFPGTAVLVLSAWCLGVLNSHGKFLLSYASAVVWNLAMIAVLVWGHGRHSLAQLVEWLAWGSVVGSVLQLAVQWPVVVRVLGGLRMSLGRGIEGVRTILRNFGPAMLGRGATQLSAFADSWVASWLMDGSVTVLANAQTIYMLPASLFGTAISASQLPAMSSDAGDESQATARIAARLESALSRVIFFVLPSSIAFLTIGGTVGALLFRSGRFGAAESRWLWGTLAALSVGLLAGTLSRLYATVLFALQDTRTPQRTAFVRVAIGVVLGMGGALWFGGWLGLDPQWNVAFLALGSAIAAWVEYALLRSHVRRRLGGAGARPGQWVRVGLAALLGAAAGVGVQRLVGAEPGVWAMLGVVGAFAVVFGVVALALRVPEATQLVGAVRRRLM